MYYDGFIVSCIFGTGALIIFGAAFVCISIETKTLWRNLSVVLAMILVALVIENKFSIANPFKLSDVRYVCPSGLTHGRETITFVDENKEEQEKRIYINRVFRDVPDNEKPYYVGKVGLHWYGGIYHTHANGEK